MWADGCSGRGASLRARPRPHRLRLDGHRGAGAQHHAGPARRGARLPALLGGRAPRDARHRQLVPGRARRPPRRGDDAHPGRFRRGDAAQPPATGGRRAVRHARGAAPGPDRPRDRPGTRHRPAHGRCAAPRHRPFGCRRLSRTAPGAGRVLPRRRSGRGGARHRTRPGDLVARVERLQRPGRGPAGAPVRVRAPLQRGEHPAGVGAVPRDLPTVRAARAALLDDRHVGPHGGLRCGGGAARAARGAAVPAAATGPARAPPDPGRGGRPPLLHGGAVLRRRTGWPGR